MVRRLVVVLVVVGCASGRNEEPASDAAIADSSPTSDAAATGMDSTTSACTAAFTGTLATWSFAGEAGNQASTAVATKATGITAGAVTRAAGLTAVTGSGSINASNWPVTAQRDLAKYYAFTIAPPAGCTLSITGASIDAKSSGTGPASGAVSTSVDTYAATTTVSTTAPGAVALTVTNAPGMVEVRVYGFAATAAGGTLRLQDSLSIDGQLK